MLEQFEANQALLAGIVLVVVFLAWWFWGRTRPKPQPREYTDVLSEGAEKAARNTALIDAPSAATMAAAPAVPTPAEAPQAPATEAEPVAAATTEAQPAAGPVDDLGRIKGIGPKLKAVLASLGVTSFAQIAAWTDEDIARIDAQLGAFAGRARRDNWVEQARLLAAGDTAAYEARFGKI